MSSAPRASDKLWTPANVVTVARICGVPLFIVVMLGPWPDWFSFWPDAWLWKPWLATLVFVVLAATDSLDGYLARSRHEVTNFGKFVDPLADKILTTAALLVLIELGVLPSWPVFIILCREFIVSGIRMLAAAEGVVIAASWYGKAKTVTQIIAIVLFLVKDSPVTVQFFGDAHVALYWLSWAVMTAAVVLTIVSMLDYFAKARWLLGFGESRKRNAKADASGQQSQGFVGLAEDGQSAGGHVDGGGKSGGPAASAICALRAPSDAVASLPSRDEASAPDEKALFAQAAALLERARDRGVKLATAESLTGGLVAAALTSVPGSSDVVAGGVVSYTWDVKERALGVSRKRLDEVGAVDEVVAEQMAQGALRQTGADVAVAVTGIAGPGGAEPGKPVGTVCFGLATAEASGSCRMLFAGGRAEVRSRTVRWALQMLDAELGIE